LTVAQAPAHQAAPLLPAGFPETGGDPESSTGNDALAVLLGMLLGGLLVSTGIRVLYQSERKLDD